MPRRGTTVHPDQARSRPAGAAHRGLILLVVCLALFVALLDSTVLSVALPRLQRDLGTGFSGLQWVADGYVLVFASLLLTGGAAGDRFGRRRLFLAGTAVFAAGSAGCAAAPTLGWLVAGRAVQGAGASMVMPQTLAILATAFPGHRERARAIGLWSGMSGLALLLGPVLGGVAVDALGWRSVFLVNLPIAAVTLLIGVRVLPPSTGPAGRPDTGGQLLVAATLAVLTYALIGAPHRGWGSPVTLGLLGAAAVGAGALVAAERRAPEPLLPVDLFRSPGFAVANAVLFLVTSGLAVSFFFLSVVLQQGRGLSAQATGLRLLPAMAAVVVAAPVAGLLAGRLGPRRPVVAGTGLAGTALILLGLAGGAGYGWWVPLLVGFGLGIGLTMAPVNAALVGSVPGTAAARASATGSTSQQVGALVGIALLGSVFVAGVGGALASGADRLGLAPAAQQRLVGSVLRDGGRPPAAAGPTGDPTGGVARLVDRSLAAGLRRGLLVAGAGYLAAAALAGGFLPGRAATGDPGRPGGTGDPESGPAAGTGPVSAGS